MKDAKWKKTGALLLAAAVFGNAQAMGTGGLLMARAAGSVTPIAEYDEATLALLKDNVLEYQEIPGLVEHYNPTYLKQLEQFYYNPDGSSGLTKDQLLSMAAELRAEASALEDEAEGLKEDEMIGDDEYREYKTNIKMLKRYARELEDAAEGSAASKRALSITKNQLTAEISGMMLEYQGLAANDELQKKNLEIAELGYESAKRQRELGLYSLEQVLEAEDALNSARAAVTSSSAALTKSRQALITALGWSYGADPEILPVPEPDVAKLAGYSLEADMATALNTNYDIGDIRKTDSSELGGVREKTRQLQEQEKQVRIQFEYLYKDMMQKYAAYQAIESGWTAVEAAKAQADRRYSLGLAGRLEYLSAEAAWLSAKVSKEQAALDLKAAMEAYDWAVKGLMEL